MASDEGALDLPIGDVADEPELSPSVVDTSGLTAEDFEKALKVLEAVQGEPILIFFAVSFNLIMLSAVQLGRSLFLGLSASRCGWLC